VVDGIDVLSLGQAQLGIDEQFLRRAQAQVMLEIGDVGVLQNILDARGQLRVAGDELGQVDASYALRARPRRAVQLRPFPRRSARRYAGRGPWRLPR